MSLKLIHSGRKLFLPANPAQPRKRCQNIPAAGNGISYRIVGRDFDSETGTTTWIIEKRTRKYQTTGEYTSEVGLLEQRTEQKQLSVTSQDVPTLAASAGVIMSQDVAPNDDCSKNVQTTTRTAVPASGTDSHGGPLVAETTDVQRNAAALPSTPAR